MVGVEITNNGSNRFMVQVTMDDGSILVKLMNEWELLKRINFNDIYGEELKIWQISDGDIPLDEPKKCHELGWQPMCHIMVARDEDGVIVLDGYGEDH